MSSIIRATTSSGLQVAPDNSGSLQLQTNGTTTAVTIDTSQNVGIGTTSPTYKFEVVQPAASGTATFKNTNASYATDVWLDYSQTGQFLLSARSSSENKDVWISNATSTGSMLLMTNGTERMRINDIGDVGIGASTITSLSPNYTTVQLQGSSGSGITWFVGSTRYGYAYVDAGGFIIHTANATPLVFGTNGTERLKIDASNGTLTSAATYNNTAAGSTVVVTSTGLIRRTSSSLKYKKDVETLEQTIVDNAVNNLRPVWYRTKNAEGDDKATWSHIGLIAEEVDLVEPRLVKYRTAEVTQDENGANVTKELETPVPEDVDYAKLSVILLAKVKQLEARIAVLEAK